MKRTGKDFEMVFDYAGIPKGKKVKCLWCGFEGTVGAKLDVSGIFIHPSGSRLEIKLDGEQYERLKEIKIGTCVFLTLPSFA